MSRNITLNEAATLMEAAEKWWRSLRPVHFDQADHIETPMINAVSESERELAWVVASILSCDNRPCFQDNKDDGGRFFCTGPSIKFRKDGTDEVMDWVAVSDEEEKWAEKLFGGKGGGK